MCHSFLKSSVSSLLVSLQDTVLETPSYQEAATFLMPPLHELLQLLE
jgi:hypothetical protein